MSHDRVLVRAGFLLFLVAMLGGLGIRFVLNPRMAMAGHVTGLLEGLMLVALGLVWATLRFSVARGKLVRGLFLYGAYAAWVVGWLGAIWGTSRLTPIAGAGFHTSPAKELVVAILFFSLAGAHIVGLLLVVPALFRRDDA